MYFPVFHFVVNNYGYGDKTDLFVVACNYDEAYNFINDNELYNLDMDYCDENMSNTGFVKELESDEHLPYEDMQL